MTYTRSKTKKDEQAVRQLAACLVFREKREFMKQYFLILWHFIFLFLMFGVMILLGYLFCSFIFLFYIFVSEGALSLEMKHIVYFGGSSFFLIFITYSIVLIDQCVFRKNR
ncbi:hypothetical protein BZK37_17625 [Enterococcus casseliflavus]|nr:hypothetical protein BZK37_17625 [Enterococcus casseliflavus]